MKLVHLLNWKRMREEGEARYLCVGAVYPTPDKSTTSPKHVTCKNCLKILRTRYGYLQPDYIVRINNGSYFKESPIDVCWDKFVKSFNKLKKRIRQL